jgi:large subunit ribosomal protein L29
MSAGSPELSLESLDSFDNEHLINEMKKAKAELFNLRFQKATGQLEAHGRIKAVKNDIARIFTFLRERELGIRTEPVSPVKAEDVKKKSKKDKEDATVDAVVDKETVDKETADKEKVAKSKTVEKKSNDKEAKDDKKKETK